MANERPAATIEQREYDEWPLTFSRHSFGVYTYETYGAQVEYAGRVQRDDDPDVLQRSSASYGEDYRIAWGGRHIGIDNFPPPARIRWRSKDGALHSTVIDIGALFADQLVRHNVSEQDHDPQPKDSYRPHIAIEINDRTIRVYMKAMVFTKELQDPGNPHSGFRNEPVLVKTMTF